MRTVDNESAQVRIGGEEFRVPARYIAPVPPTMKGLNVVVICGAQLGSEYTVIEYGPSQCSLKSRGRRGSKVELTLPKDTLSIVY